MGCGSSGNVAPAEPANGQVKMANGSQHDDGLPTVVLPDTPAKAKPPIAFEIPLEEFDSNPRTSTPPPHVQRLLEPPKTDISLPDIEEKLAEAEQRRREILQQRAASAQKRAAKMMRSFEEMDRVDSEQEPASMEGIKQNEDSENNLQADNKRAMTTTIHSTEQRKEKDNNKHLNDIKQTKQNITSDKSEKDIIRNSMEDNVNKKEGNRLGTAPKLKDLKDIKRVNNGNGVHIPPGPRVCEDKNI